MNDFRINLVEEAFGPAWKWTPEDKWDARHQELLEYKEEHGDCNVPPKTSQLGIWVSTQRAYTGDENGPYKHECIKNKEMLRRWNMLNSIGFIWDARRLVEIKYTAAWDTQYQKLLAFKEEHGHCNVNRGCPLGMWVKAQRQNLKNVDGICARRYL